MTQEYENISAWVDGDSVDGDISAEVFNDPVLRAKWKSYHLTRDLLRNDMSNDVSFDISDKVAQALQSELDIVAPKRTWRDTPLGATVVPLIKQSGQWAVAACVTAMVIFGYQTFNQPEVTQPFMTAPPVIGPQGGMAPVSLQQTRDVEQDRMTQLLEQRRQINALIQDHMRQQKLKTVINKSSAQSEVTNSDASNGEDGSGANSSNQ